MLSETMKEFLRVLFTDEAQLNAFLERPDRVLAGLDVDTVEHKALYRLHGRLEGDKQNRRDVFWP